MNEIDENYRPKADFFGAWALFAAGTVIYAKPWTFQLPWYSKAAFVLVVPFIVTVLIYVPILFVSQVMRSGVTYRRVLRIILAIMVAMVVSLGGVVYLSGYSPGKTRLVALPFFFAAIMYLDRVFQTKAQKPASRDQGQR